MNSSNTETGTPNNHIITSFVIPHLHVRLRRVRRALGESAGRQIVQ